MRYLFDPVCEWVDAQDVQPIVLANTSASPPVDRSATIVDTLLVYVQGILSQCNAAQKTLQEDEDDDGHRDPARRGRRSMMDGRGGISFGFSLSLLLILNY